MLLTNLTAATMQDGYGLIEDAAVLVEGNRIAWVGPRADAPTGLATDCEGRLLTPGLIDCHTHLVYGGSRAHEFEQRLTGVSYAEIAKAGGGIASTVRATRSQSEADLSAAALKRLDALLAEGVTTIEIKSGYGLDRDTEIKMLRVARELSQWRPVDVVTSYLGAHALPPEFKDDRAAYLDLVCNEVMPVVAQAKLADAVDAFCEGIAFSVAETRRVFAAARALGLPVKLHAEQLTNLGGSKMAAEFGALSVDHIEYLDQDGVDALARSGTVAVLLPGAFYYLREKQAPPVAALRKAGVPITVATDLNPGTSPVHSILTSMNMACVLFGLTPEEALRGVTVNAARALGLADRGMIAPGMKADLVLWDAARPGDLAYPLGFNPLAAVIHNGDVCAGDSLMSDAQPLYAKVKDHILENIRSGAWQAGRRVPSENELVESFGISRMTANRALRELTAEGFLSRVPGVGTFVKEAPALSSLMELRNIAEEIAQRGHRYSSRLIAKSEIDSNPALVEEFEDRALKRLFHIVIVHEENGVPVQLEDRFVNPLVVADFLDRDFADTTPTAILLAAAPVDELEHTVEAALPSSEQQRLLGIGALEPCLALHRRSWSRGRVATVATLTYPASRYALYSRHRTSERGTFSQ